MLFVEGGGWGHGTAVVRVAAFGGAGASVAGLGMGDAYRWRREQEARCLSWGKGDADMGRRWRVWRRSGERGRRWWGLEVGDAYRQRG